MVLGVIIQSGSSTGAEEGKPCGREPTRPHRNSRKVLERELAERKNIFLGEHTRKDLEKNYKLPPAKISPRNLQMSVKETRKILSIERVIERNMG